MVKELVDRGLEMIRKRRYRRTEQYLAKEILLCLEAQNITELAEQAEYAAAVTTSAFYEGRIEKNGYRKLLEMMDITERTVKKAFRKNNTGRTEECER